jgi:hypothetical protein
MSRSWQEARAATEAHEDRAARDALKRAAAFAVRRCVPPRHVALLTAAQARAVDAVALAARLRAEASAAALLRAAMPCGTPRTPLLHARILVPWHDDDVAAPPPRDWRAAARVLAVAADDECLIPLAVAHGAAAAHGGSVVDAMHTQAAAVPLLAYRRETTWAAERALNGASGEGDALVRVAVSAHARGMVVDATVTLRSGVDTRWPSHLGLRVSDEWPLHVEPRLRRR